jgi:hypothetical protein
MYYIDRHLHTAVAAAAVSKTEQTDDFVWFFKQVEKFVGDSINSVHTIISDEASSIATAIETCFASSVKHQLCLWHLLQNLQRIVTEVAFGRAFGLTIRQRVRKLLYYDGYTDNQWNAEYEQLIQLPESIGDKTRSRFLTYMSKIQLKRHQFCYYKLKYSFNLDTFVSSRAEALHRYVLHLHLYICI